MSDASNPIAQGAAWLFARAHPEALARVAGIPGPTPLFPLGNLDDFLGKNPWEVLHRLAREHGDGGLVCWWWRSEPVVTPASPEVAHEVLVAKELDFRKESPLRALRPLLTDVEPFLANPPDWEGARARSLFALPGMRAWLDAQAPRFADRARARLGALAGADPEDALNLLRRMGFDAFTEMAVGETFDAAAYDDMLAMAAAGAERMTAMGDIDEHIEDARFARARDALWGRLRACVDRARGGDLRGRTDLLAHALTHGTSLTDDELPPALANLYFSGLLSTTSALLTTLWMLSRHDEVCDAVRAEVAALRAPWTASSLAALTALDGAIREATRLYPPVPVYLRNSPADRAVTLGGYSLPRNTRVFLSNYVIHRDPRLWEEPDAFRPARWSDALRAEVPYGHARFWPFGMGRRACAGQEIALAYLRAVTAVAVGERDVRVGADVAPDALESEHFFACFSATNLALSVPR